MLINEGKTEISALSSTPGVARLLKTSRYSFRRCLFNDQSAELLLGINSQSFSIPFGPSETMVFWYMTLQNGRFRIW